MLSQIESRVSRFFFLYVPANSKIPSTLSRTISYYYNITSIYYYE